MRGRVAYGTPMPDPTNAQIAAALDELGDLYELDGAVSYRVIAYRNAAKAVRESSVSIIAMTREGRVTTVPGIGKTLEEKLRALDETGDIPALVKLRAKFPPGLIEVMHLPGFGPKRARKLFDELGVDSLDALRAAVEAGKIRELRGFGLKAEDAAQADARRRTRPAGGPAPRVVLSRAEAIAEEVVAALRAHPASDRVEVAGSLRRRADSVKDLDIIATASDPKALAARARRARARGVRAVLRRRGRARDDPHRHEDRPQGRRARPVRQRAPALHGLQGPQRRAARERRPARAAHLRVRDPRRRDGRDAALRDRGGGLRAARAAVDPARAARGPRRAGGRARGRPARAGRRSRTSRATCTCTRPPPTGSRRPRRWRAAARERGLEYIAITDHSASHGFGNDVSPAELERRIDEIHALNERMEGIEVLIGTESNILTDGSLDYPDELLERLDWVIASVHTSFRMRSKEMTDRMVAAIEHPLVDAIGHPTGRKIERRPPYALDLERVIEAAARTGTMLEINAAPDRRDLDEIHAREAARAGVPILIDSDAHSTTNLRLLSFGVDTARRAWLTPEQVANARPVAGVPKAPQTGTFTSELIPEQEEPPMSDGTKDDLKGRTKEAAGSLTDDQSLKNEGKVDRGTGKVKDAAGSVSDKVKDVVNPDRK